MPRSLLFATTNMGKLAELRSLLTPSNFSLISLNELDPSLASLDIRETGSTFTSNARLKAQAYAQLTNLLALCDDSGLVVDALNGAPGVHSKRYGTDDTHRIRKLLQAMSHVPPTQRTARFICAIAIHDPKAQKTYTTIGKTHGFITQQPQGTHGFGYDPIFFSTDLEKTFGQATAKEKNRVSHRSRALLKATQILTKLTQSA